MISDLYIYHKKVMDNSNFLPIDYELIIKNSNSTFNIRISEVIGVGGTCIVYKGENQIILGNKILSKSIIVKEFYPSAMNIRRLSDMSLEIPNKELFEKMKYHFYEGQSKHVQFYEYYKDQSLPRMFFYGEANNTVYAVSDSGKGKTLSQINFDSLNINRIASIMESVCSGIQKIHVKEKLYLDCKPDNFFYYLNNDSLQSKVYLFDFDTVTSMSDTKKGKYLFCAASNGWIPPEQILVVDTISGKFCYNKPENIGYHTDIYSIGAIFFWLLTHCRPTISDIQKIQNRSFDWEMESSYCDGVEIEVIELIQDILESTLQPNDEIRKDKFPNCISIKNVRDQYRKLYGLTVGADIHFKPIHQEIKILKKDLFEILSKNENYINNFEKNNFLSKKDSDSIANQVEMKHYKEVYSNELENLSIEIVAEKISNRILEGECFRLELDNQILSIINKIIYNRKEYSIERKEGMVKVPKGSFIMGGESRILRSPIRVEFISYDYWIDSKPVTVAQYRKFIREAGEMNYYGYPLKPKGKNHYPLPDVNYGITGPKLYVDYFEDSNYDNYPITFVDWWDAFAYAKWAQKDLPLEIEWEKAARGIDGRIYPFGNEYDNKYCNVLESKIDCLTEADSFPDGISPYGCYNMSGNIWEWCADNYDFNQQNNLKKVKGGSFRRDRNKAMPSFCQCRGVLERWISRGFRCVRRANNNE